MKADYNDFEQLVMGLRECMDEIRELRREIGPLSADIGKLDKDLDQLCKALKVKPGPVSRSWGVG